MKGNCTLKIVFRIAVIGLAAAATVSGCRDGGSATPRDANVPVDGKRDAASQVHDGAVVNQDASVRDSTQLDAETTLADGSISTKDSMDGKDGVVASKDGALDKSDLSIVDTLRADNANRDTRNDSNRDSLLPSQLDGGTVSVDSSTWDGPSSTWDSSQSETTACSIDGECPAGYICGSASTAGATNVCYDLTETGCGASDLYYCLGTTTCWSEQVACSTVVDCGDGVASACASENYAVDCSNSDICRSNGSGGGSDGGSGEVGTSAGVCSPSSSDTACATCMDQFCCSELSACSNQTACVNLLGCLVACSSSDTTCVNGCDSSYSAGVTSLKNLTTCTDASCGTSCN